MHVFSRLVVAGGALALCKWKEDGRPNHLR
jgi:hypothetical protein